MKQISVVVAGHICLDIIPDLGTFTAQGFAQAFHPGRLIEVGNETICTGGPVSNTGLALLKLGIDNLPASERRALYEKALQLGEGRTSGGADGLSWVLPLPQTNITPWTTRQVSPSRNTRTSA